MMRDPAKEIALIILLGAAAQWLAWRVRIPSILALLVAGFVAGPLMGWFHPDELIGDLLLPFVSFSVAVILFEGGLSLRLDELRKVGRAVRNLLTIGVALTWMMVAAAAYFVVGLDVQLAIILGALLTVTGPTVILPMLRHIRPRGRVASILRWEGIANDPIGALLAVLVFEFVIATDAHSPAAFIAGGLLKTVFLGGGIGVAAGYVLSIVLHRYWIPDHLTNPLTLAIVIIIFFISNWAQPESGLFAVTLAGLVFANRSPSSVLHIVEFKESLGVFLISILFVVLSARFSASDFRALLDWRILIFVSLLILVVRPLSVIISTLGTETSWPERFFLAWLAPRGIVAAAVSSVFALQLEVAGHGQAKLLMLLTFATIVGTVSVYGITSAGVARRLGLAEQDPQGILIVGAQKWSCRIARTLTDLGYRVVVLDTNRENVTIARMSGLSSHVGSALAGNIADDVDLSGIGRLLALTPNDEVNALATQQFARILGRANVYQLPPKSDQSRRGSREKHLHGRWLFESSCTYLALDDKANNGWAIKVTKLTPEFDYAALRKQNVGGMIALFVVTPKGRLSIVTADETPSPVAGQTLISLVPTTADDAILATGCLANGH